MAEEKTIELKIKKLSWKTISIVLVAVLAVSLFFNLKSPSGMFLAKERLAKTAVDYINNNLVQPGTSVSLVSVEEEKDFYKITISYQNKQTPIYITKDGNNLFLSQPLDIAKELPKEATQASQTSEAPKKDKPTAELFVMSFCPYGIQAENTMKPVFDLLGSNADIKVRFIAQTGDTIDSVQSLHGTTEAQEDLRQLSIMKNYDSKTYWNYLAEINKNCPSAYRDASALDACWKAAAAKAGIDAVKIETYSKSPEALALLKEDEKAASKYGVSGSPTLVINGAVYNGARTSDAFKQGICSGFSAQPSECSQALSSTAQAASGGCGQ